MKKIAVAFVFAMLVMVGVGIVSVSENADMLPPSGSASSTTL